MLFDGAMLGLSLRDFWQDPSFLNGLGVLGDGVGFFLPMVPALGKPIQWIGGKVGEIGRRIGEGFRGAWDWLKGRWDDFWGDGNETVMRLVDENEARLIGEAGALVGSQGRDFTRVFLPPDLERMLGGVPDRTHLVEMPVGAGWSNLIDEGGAVISQDGFGYIVDVGAVNGFQTGPPVIIPLPL